MDLDFAWVINLDYEKVLAGRDCRKKYHKIISEMEHISFWFGLKNPIVQHRNYDTAYLEYIEMLTGQKVNLVKQYRSERNWWGDTENFEIAKKRNSKYEAIRLAKSLDLCPSSYQFISNNNDRDHYLNSFESERYIIFKEYGFSGNGLSFLSKAEIKSTEIYDTFLISPEFERVFDYGVYDDGDGVNIIKNDCNSLGQFKGGEVISSAIELNEMSISLDEIISTYTKVRGHFEKNTTIEVDGFFYKERGILKSCFLSEINARKTMGLLIKKLSDMFGMRYSKLIVLKNILKNVTFLEILKFLEKKFSKKVFLLSPVDGKFLLFFLVSSSRNDLDEIEKKLNMKFVKKI